MKKVFDQTVRDIKREVNKKVLKVPGIEQKVLDATSNEAWGPHGTLLADIALASRNYHEYQIIMTVLWKRINDTGKNWRHVYKGLTVLDYLVANGSERVIDDIKEHAYQISTLSSFHYIDSGGRDQGNNVRKKSQSLVDLVNDKERIIEVRQKAAANRDKFRTSPGGMHRPSSYGNFDDGYDDRNGRERDYNYRYGDRDRHSTEYEDRYSYKDEDYRGRSRSVGDYSMRSRSSERDNKDDDSQFSSRGMERKFSEQNIGAPPSYEDAVGASPTEPNKELPTSGSSSPAVHASPDPVVEELQAFDEFDPRGPVSGVATSPPPPVEMDLLGSLAIVPISSSSEAVNNAESAVGVSMVGEDPFGDSPFKAFPVSESNSSSALHASAEPLPSFADPFSSASQEPNHLLPSGNKDIDILAGILPLNISEIPSQNLPLNTHVPEFSPQTYVSQPPIAPMSEAPHQNVHVSEIPPQNFIPQPLNTSAPRHPAYMPQTHTTNGLEYQPQNYVPQTINGNGNSIQHTGLPPVQTQLDIAPQPSKDKFQTKSTVWSETLSRGLVNLNISGPKTNPLSDIGVDFDSINRREKRFEKQIAAPVTSNVAMGKAMGAGSGIGRAGASAIRPQQTPQNNPHDPQMRFQQSMLPPNNPYGYPYNPYGGYR